MRAAISLVTLFGLAMTVGCAADDRERKIHDDKRKLAADQSWVYDDLKKGIATAAAKRKPLMILIRCLP